MSDDTTPKPEFGREPESLPEPGPLPPDDYPASGDWDPRITERPPPQDYGIPGIDLDRSGQFHVPRLHRLKPDNGLLEQAQNDFFMGLNLDEFKSIAWFWPQRIPIGKLTLIEGESNSGTSFVVTDLAARVTRGGRWPGVGVSPTPNSGESGYEDVLPQPVFLQPASHVLFVNGGDNIYDTLVPRLLKRGANLADLTVLSGITTHDPAELRKGKADTCRRLALPADLGHIEYQLRLRPQTRLVVVDSLSDFCQTDKQFRETVRGLHEMAERCNVAIVATARPKNDRRARSKLTPSADRRSESLRCVLNVLVDPHDPSLRYLAPARMNFCREPKWLPFRIGEGIVEWGPELAAAPVYQRNSPADQEKTTLLHEAMECLKETLAHGDLSAKIAIQQVMGCGFSRATVIRARRELGVRSVRKGFGPHGSFIWTLKKAGEVTVAGDEPASGTGKNGNGENGHGSGATASQAKLVRNGSHSENGSTPAEEFGDIDFDRLPRELVLESLNYLRSLEAGAAGERLPNGKPGKNGKPSKNGKRKPR